MTLATFNATRNSTDASGCWRATINCCAVATHSLYKTRLFAAFP